MSHPRVPTLPFVTAVHESLVQLQCLQLNPSLTGQAKHVNDSLPAPLFYTARTLIKNNKYFGGQRLPQVKDILRTEQFFYNYSIA